MIRLCASDDLPANSARRFDVDGLRIALVRIGDDFYALGDRCSHADVSLADGDVLVVSRELECWKHGSAFSVETGEPSCLPALKAVPVYRVLVEDGDVFVTTDAATPPLDPATKKEADR